MPKFGTKKDADEVKKAYQEFEAELARIRRELKALVLRTVQKIDSAQIEKARASMSPHKLGGD